MVYTLPESLEVSGKNYPIRYNFQAALDILTGLEDPELSDRDKVMLVTEILYKEPIPHIDMEEAIKKAYWFLDGGDIPHKNGKSPRLMDWEQDFPLIVAPVNRVIGHDIRADKDLHWWTFLSAYAEIGGDCLFAQVVGIREKKARGEKLEKYEKKWAARNAHIINLKDKYTAEDDDKLAAYGIKRKKRD